MILEKIRQLYPQFTKSQRKLADYIANHYQEAAFMTASDLARRLKINEATVIRFAQRLDYPGYPDLSAGIQRIVKRELAVKADVLEDPEHPIAGILTRESESLRRAISHLSTDLAEEVVTALSEARRICLFGQGIAGHLAGAFCDQLRTQGYAAEHVLAEIATLAAALSDLSDEDVVVAFSINETEELTAHALRLAGGKGCRTVAFALSSVSPTAQAADAAVICPMDGSFALPSITALAAVADAFAQALALLKPEQAERAGERIRQAYQALK
jgi:DNA-binding MurR/RpiR family transcriptional regulator